MNSLTFFVHCEGVTLQPPSSDKEDTHDANHGTPTTACLAKLERGRTLEDLQDWAPHSPLMNQQGGLWSFRYIAVT